MPWLRVPYAPALASFVPALAQRYQDAQEYEEGDGDVGLGPYSHSGAPPNGFKNGIAEKGAEAVDIVTGTHYTNTGTKAATVWTQDAPSGGGSGAIFLSENNLVDATFTADQTRTVDWSDGWTVFNEGGFVAQDPPTRIALPQAGIYELFATGLFQAPNPGDGKHLVIEIVGENLGGDFTGAQGYLAVGGADGLPLAINWIAREKFPANALVGVTVKAAGWAATIANFHVGLRLAVPTA